MADITQTEPDETDDEPENQVTRDTGLTPLQQFLSAKDLAKRYNVGIPTIWRWQKDGTIPRAIKLTDQITRWRLDELVQWEQNRDRVGERPSPLDISKARAAAKRKAAAKG